MVHEPMGSFLMLLGPLWGMPGPPRIQASAVLANGIIILVWGVTVALLQLTRNCPTITSRPPAPSASTQEGWSVIDGACLEWLEECVGV